MTDLAAENAALRAEVDQLKARIISDREKYGAEVEQRGKALAEAAQEINCAGPVAHRIRVLKREHAARVAALVGALDRLVSDPWNNDARDAARDLLSARAEAGGAKRQHMLGCDMKMPGGHGCTCGAEAGGGER